MLTVQISESPKVYVFDTPGIMLPYIKDMDVGMKLAMCGNDVPEIIIYTVAISA